MKLNLKLPRRPSAPPQDRSRYATIMAMMKAQDLRTVVDNLSQDLDTLRARLQGTETRHARHMMEMHGRLAGLRHRVAKLDALEATQDLLDERQGTLDASTAHVDVLEDARDAADYVDATVKDHVRQLRDLASTMKAHATQDRASRLRTTLDAVDASLGIPTQAPQTPAARLEALARTARAALDDIDPATLRDLLPVDVVLHVAKTLHVSAVGDPAPPRHSFLDLPDEDQDRLIARARWLVAQVLDGALTDVEALDGALTATELAHDKESNR